MTATPNKKLKILHVVRRYGPVGGMERYVWEITRELRDLGHQVEVLCEICLADKPDGIVVHELGSIAARPRWLALLRFGNRVANWLKINPHGDFLIHSHERLSSHHITTFHGPPFATIFERSWWRLISLRVAMQLFLEKRELVRAQYIVPNSDFIKQQLSHYYPEITAKLTTPIVPGVVSGKIRSPIPVPADGGTVGFVGKEWKRKGLPFAAEIIKQLRHQRPQLKFRVIGPAVADIKHLFSDEANDQLSGWSDTAHYAEFDVLLHPAKAEPYGMVISEAMAARVPVVISDLCGAATQVLPDAGTVLSLDAGIDAWVSALEQQLTRSTPAPQFVRNWREVAQEYEQVYYRINL
ncbi:MAG TPA: glycosyl transferase family 1 [Gallionella sp.]|nr:MAG: glycosyl transferase family 1 [Gallionellales bacterium GWA2_54_124]OGT19117.1 MAG: glycosyl transferase family 1 [Gallionellales bacterium RIFOXYD12_FULL_53_10]HCI53959.1 glycosyl transferase family 1 [Gallionella sp.]